MKLLQFFYIKPSPNSLSSLFFSCFLRHQHIFFCQCRCKNDLRYCFLTSVSVRISEDKDLLFWQTHCWEMKSVAVHYVSFINPISPNVCITRVMHWSGALQTFINRCQELIGGSQKENLMESSRNKALVSSPSSHRSVSSPPSWVAWFSSHRPTACARWAVSRGLGGRTINRALSPLSQSPAPGGTARACPGVGHRAVSLGSISSLEELLSPAEGPRCGLLPPGLGPPSILSPHQLGGPVPPARGCPHGFVAVPAAVTCSPRGVLGPLEMENGEERQEAPQEVPGQRCGEPEGEGGRVRAGPGPAPRRPAPPVPYPRRPAPGRPCCGSRRPRSERTGCAAARLPSPPRARMARTAPPSWKAATAGGHVGEVVRAAPWTGRRQHLAEPAPRPRHTGRRDRKGGSAAIAVLARPHAWPLRAAMFGRAAPRGEALPC